MPIRRKIARYKSINAFLKTRYRIGFTFIGREINLIAVDFYGNSSSFAFNFEFIGSPAVIQSYCLAFTGNYFALVNHPVGVRKRNFEIPAGFKPFEFYCFPLSGHCGKQRNKSAVALQKHFGHSCGRAEVTVYLERRMHVPQIGVSSLFQQILQKQISVIALAGPRARAKSVRKRPARRFVAAVIERNLGGVERSGGIARYLLARHQRHELR